jgi:phosphatidylserine/phosphatidylglycerophosphate/cardiolipin synthase-like enzyme
MKYFIGIILFFLSMRGDCDVLGKTHFIIGTPTNCATELASSGPSLVQSDIQQKSVSPSSPCQILFAPDTNVRNHLLQLIDKERQAIYLAIFMVTDADVANALCEAKKRGVIVELITDVGCLKDRASKVNQLSKQGCSVYIYNPTLAKAKGVSLMHHKFALFARNDRGPQTWTGSYNFTKAANNVNQENVVIFSDKQVFDTFFEQFKILKGRSYHYTTSKILAS